MKVVVAWFDRDLCSACFQLLRPTRFSSFTGGGAPLLRRQLLSPCDPCLPRGFLALLRSHVRSPSWAAFPATKLTESHSMGVLLRCVFLGHELFEY